MEIGKTYLHTHIKDLSCEVVSHTSRGAKVKQTEAAKGRKKAKTITAFYNAVDFGKGGIWSKMN